MKDNCRARKGVKYETEWDLQWWKKVSRQDFSIYNQLMHHASCIFATEYAIIRIISTVKFLPNEQHTGGKIERIETENFLRLK